MKRFIPSLLAIVSLPACGIHPIPTPYRPVQPVIIQPNTASFRLFQREATDLVEVPGFKTGDKLKLDGPVWFDGTGLIHELESDKFKVEFKVSNYHYLLNVTRVDQTTCYLIMQDLNSGKVDEGNSAYLREGSKSTFDIGKGKEVEAFTVHGIRHEYFDLYIQQPSRTIKFKVTKG